MAKTINELKSAAAVVRDATEEKENTALRVGQLLIDMIDTVEEEDNKKLPKSDVENSFNSTSTVKALSAAKGKALKDLLDELEVEVDKKADSADLAEVATSGSYNDLSDKPTIPDGSTFVPKTDIADNTTTNDATKVLSANQGRVLANDIIISHCEEITYDPVDAYINSEGIWKPSSGNYVNYKHGRIPAHGGEVYYILTTTSTTVRAAYITNDSPSGSPAYVNGTVLMTCPLLDVLYEFPIPDGCRFFVFNAGTGYGSPRLFKLRNETINTKVDDFRAVATGSNGDKIAEISQPITSYDTVDYTILANGEFGTSTTNKHGLLSVTEGEVYYIYGESTNVRIAFATSDSCSTSNHQKTIPLVPNTRIQALPSANSFVKVVIPNGCLYLLFNLGSSSDSYNTKIYKVGIADMGSIGGVQRQDIDDIGILGAEEIVGYPSVNYLINGTGKFGTTNTYKHAALPVSEGEVYYLMFNYDSVIYVFANSDTATSGADLSGENGVMVDGTSLMRVPHANRPYKVVIPTGCTHLLFNTLYTYDFGARVFRFPTNVSIADEFSTSINELLALGAVEVTDLNEKNGFMYAKGVFGSGSTYKHAAIPVSVGEEYIIRCGSPYVYAAFATSDSVPSEQPYTIPLVTGTNVMYTPFGGRYYKFTIPSGCTHLLFNTTGVDSQSNPKSYGAKCWKLPKHIGLKELPIGLIRENGGGNHGQSESTTMVATDNIVEVPYLGVSYTFVLPDNVRARVITWSYYGGSSTTGYSNESRTPWVENGGTVTLPNNAVSYQQRIQFGSADGTSALTKATVDGYIATGQIKVYYPSDTIVQRNKEFYKTVGAAKYKFQWASSSAAKSNQSMDAMPTLVHVSDEHGDMVRLENAIEYAEYINADAVLSSGDQVSDYGFHGSDYQKAVIDMHPKVPLLSCIGNHETLIKSPTTSSSPATYYTSNQEVFDEHMAFLVEQQGAHYLSEAGVDTEVPYYYVDFASKNLRVITLCQFDEGIYGNGGLAGSIGQAQMSWFVATLKSTPTGYGVIVMFHISEAPTLKTSGMDSFWQTDNYLGTTRNSTGGQYTYAPSFQVFVEDENGSYSYAAENKKYKKVTHNGGYYPIMKVVDAFIGKTAIVMDYYETEEITCKDSQNNNHTYPRFIDYTGADENRHIEIDDTFEGIDDSTEFIAYVTGHIHKDSVGYVSGTIHRQLNLNVCTTNCHYPRYNSYVFAETNDLPRGGKGVTQDAFNVYTIDRQDGWVKIARVGSNVNYKGEERKFMIAPYREGVEIPPQAKAKKRQVTTDTITITYDIEILDASGSETPFTAQELSNALDVLLDGWQNEIAALALYKNIISDISDGRKIENVTTSIPFYSALNTISIDFDSSEKFILDFSNATENGWELSADKYVDFGTRSAIKPTLPTFYTAADEFIFTFVCSSDNCDLTLPTGVKWADNMNFDADKEEGVKFQVSIMDGIAAYLKLTPNNE